MASEGKIVLNRPNQVRRGWQWAVRQTGGLIVALGAMMLASYVTALLAFPKPNGRIVLGDATHHFVQLRSLVFDRDLDFHNEYVRIYNLVDASVEDTDWVYAERTTTGRVRNYMPVGPAILWAPLYVLVALVSAFAATLGWIPPPDGYGVAFQLAPGITGVVAATTATYLSWRLARRATDAASAAAGTLAIWLGSHAIYYSLASPNYSHAVSMLTSAWFFGYWLRTRERESVRDIAFLGALAGLSSLMRWQDVVFLLIPAIEALRLRSWARRLAGLAAAGLAWLIVFSPQMIIWQVLYGRAFALPQGPSFMRWASPHLIDVLFSTNHGLLTWAPILALSLIGLAGFVRRARGTALPITAVLVASWYVNAAVADWWAGEAYGARRFLSLYPLFVIGVAVWAQALGRPVIAPVRRVVLLSVLVVANGLLLLQYEVFMKGLVQMAPYPRGGFDMWLARFVVPVRLLEWWLR